VFEVAAPIQSLAKCVVRSIIRFLNTEGERLAEIDKQIVAVYDNVMNQQNVTKLCCDSPKEGLMFTTNKGAVGHLSSLTTFFRKFEEKIEQIDAWQ
jgi:alkyl hydroperoxide reductase subunit AhpF